MRGVMSKREEIGPVLLVIAAYTPSMIWNIMKAYLRMKRRARRAGRDFRRTLMSNGVPERFARELSYEYESAFSLRTIFNEFGPRAGAKKG
jgi:hypothetical protein